MLHAFLLPVAVECCYILRKKCMTASNAVFSLRFRDCFSTILCVYLERNFVIFTVNFTNRSGDNPVSKSTLAASYAGATTGAIITALSLNKLSPKFPPILGR